MSSVIHLQHQSRNINTKIIQCSYSKKSSFCQIIFVEQVTHLHGSATIKATHWHQIESGCGQSTPEHPSSELSFQPYIYLGDLQVQDLTKGFCIAFFLNKFLTVGRIDNKLVLNCSQVHLPTRNDEWMYCNCCSMHSTAHQHRSC